MACFTGTWAVAQQHKPTYALYTNNGQPLAYETFIESLTRADVVLFGELHNHALVHWLQLEVTQAVAAATNNGVALGAEMFEADNQTLINEYLQGHITHRNLTNDARLWRNYTTDYRPLLDFAKQQGLPFVATNVPRRYASWVSRQGLAGLDSTISPEALQWLAPLPVTVDPETPGYADMLAMDMGGHGSSMNAEFFVQAQALKDATMAHRIFEHLPKGQVLIHYNGNFHSKAYGGIYWYLKQLDKRLKVKTIAVVEADTLGWQKDYEKDGDFILVVPKNFTRTY